MKKVSFLKPVGRQLSSYLCVPFLRQEMPQITKSLYVRAGFIPGQSVLDLCVAEVLLLLRVRRSSPARYHSANITRSRSFT